MFAEKKKKKEMKNESIPGLVDVDRTYDMYGAIQKVRVHFKSTYELDAETLQGESEKPGPVDVSVPSLGDNGVNVTGCKIPVICINLPSWDAEEVGYVRQVGECNQPEMSELEYRIWREYIQQRCGQYFMESRMRFMSQRLWERMRLRGIRSYSEYYHYVIYNSAGEEEWKELQETLLNLETSFFRHLPSFEALTGHILPTLMREKQKYGVNGIAMWSAGCSMGVEPYSLAMAFLEMVAPASPPIEGEVLPLDQREWLLNVSGTDISWRSLDKARRGMYKPHEVRYMPDLYRENYLTKVEDEHGVFYRVGKRVREMVKFSYLNLSDPEGNWITAQDVIFCQNVLIYFEPKSRVEVVRRLCQRLNLGGYLVLAPAEVVGLKLPGVEPVRLTDSLIYQRIR